MSSGSSATGAGASSALRSNSPGAACGPLADVAGTPVDAATILEAFRWHLDRHPDREHITLLDGDEATETVTYRQLWSDASETARGLESHGIGRGDAVVIMLPTCREFFEVCLGAMLIGAVPVPMYPPLRWSQVEEHVRGRAAIMANCFAPILVTAPEAMILGRILRAELPDLRAIVTPKSLRRSDGAITPPAMAGSETALLQYTSGSTGDPKGVVLSHAILLANIRAMGQVSGVHSRDRFLSWLPLYHDMGLIGAWMGTMYHAVPLVLMSPTSFLARPARWLWAIHRHRATISAGPNFAYDFVASKVRDAELVGLDLSCWRLAFNGSEPVRAETLERFAKRFAPYGFDRKALTPVYGLAECAVGLAFPVLGRGPQVDRIDRQALARDGRAVPGTGASDETLDIVACGRPIPSHELQIVDANGGVMPERMEGRIEFRGPSATLGYFGNPEATAKLRHGDWLDTGDLGYVADGEIYITSRTKDLIKRVGRSIHPHDVEAAIGEIPGIRKGCVAVFGTLDRNGGTEKVIVVAESTVAVPAQRTALQSRITETAGLVMNGAPNEVWLVQPRTVPKTSSGKIRRASCRELYEKGLLAAPRRAIWMQFARMELRAARMRIRCGWRALRDKRLLRA
jgi:acyl-CoA synthetase (AMP-forming)/AMP-acid ligase II